MEIKFSSFDYNGDGKLNLGAEADKFKNYMENAIRTLISDFEADGSERISKETREFIKSVVERTDKINDDNGNISKDEFNTLSFLLYEKFDISIDELEKIGPQSNGTMIEKLANAQDDSQKEGEMHSHFGESFVEDYLERIEGKASDVNDADLGLLSFSLIDVITGEESSIKVTVSDAEVDVYNRLLKADKSGDKLKNGDGRIAFGTELTNFYKGFSSTNNNILWSDDIDNFKKLTRFYFNSEYTYIKGKWVRAVDLSKNPKIGTEDQPGFHRYSKPGEDLVLGDLVKDYGS